MEEKMKKITKAWVVLVVLSLALLALASCSKDSGKFDEGDKMTLVVAEEEVKVFEIPLRDFKKSDSVIDVLDYLKSEGKLDYEVSGTMVTKVGNLKNEGNGYIYFYTTVEEDVDVSEYATSVQYGEISITSSGVGAESMHLENGAIVYIGILVWD